MRPSWLKNRRPLLSTLSSLCRNEPAPASCVTMVSGRVCIPRSSRLRPDIDAGAHNLRGAHLEDQPPRAGDAAGRPEDLRPADADVLRPPVAMMDEAVGRPAGTPGLLQGVEDERRRRVSADPPADDAPVEEADDEGHTDHAGPGRDVGEVRDPEHVRRGCPHRLAAHDAFQPETRQQPGDAVAPDLEAFAVELEPDLPRAMDGCSCS